MGGENLRNGDIKIFNLGAGSWCYLDLIVNFAEIISNNFRNKPNQFYNPKSIKMKHQLILGLALGALTVFGAGAQVRAVDAPVKLLDAPMGLMAPVWSPDGRQIAVTTDNYAGILVADAEGSNLRMLTGEAGSGYKMCWSTDCRTILGRVNVEQGGRTFRQAKRYDSTTGRATEAGRLSRSTALPMAESADGLYRAMMDDAAGVAAVTPALAQFAGRTVINPAQSPDGTKVAFQVVGRGMWVINNDGTGLRSLGQGSHPSWMPDNKTLVYTVVTDNGEQFTGSTLMSVNITTGATSTLLSQYGMIPMTPAVSPDGSKVAFENATDADIYILNIR